MNLLKKLNIKFLDWVNFIKLNYIKFQLNDQFTIGAVPKLKNTTRINVWGKQGKISIGDYFSIGYNSELYSWEDQLRIGNGTSLNDNCKIYGSVTIGSNCLLASNIFISSGTHNFLYNPYLPIKTQDNLNAIIKPITIEDDCWLGFGVVVMPGVYIGKGAIIGSNAVVTKDVFPYSINAGIPSREIGKRLDFANSYHEINSNTPEHWPFFYKGCNYRQFDNLSTLKKGIEIIDSTSVFLVTKIASQKLKIKGFSNNKMKLKGFINKSLFGQAQIDEGFFEINLSLTNQDSYYPKVLDFISNELKDRFNVIVIETEPNEEGGTSKNNVWKISSIGYYEN